MATPKASVCWFIQAIARSTAVLAILRLVRLFNFISSDRLSRQVRFAENSNTEVRLSLFLNKLR
ncbi:MAG: hypothetical protein WA919_18730 [Coleofasciculaceae cyanobacterium]